MESTKTCTACGEAKPRSEYGKHRRGRDGLRPTCRACRKNEAARRYQANGERIRAVNQRWRDGNRDQHRALSRAWNAANAERYRETNAAWLAANKERKAATNAAWIEAHRERKRATSAAWTKANRARKNEAWHRRVARARDAHVANVERSLIWERDAGVCGICDQPADPSDWHLDHVIPLSRGGTHEPDNVQVSHPRCNMSKGNRMPADEAAS